MGWGKYWQNRMKHARSFKAKLCPLFTIVLYPINIFLIKVFAQDITGIYQIL